MLFRKSVLSTEVYFRSPIIQITSMITKAIITDSFLFSLGNNTGSVLTHVELLCKFATGILCGQPLYKATYASSKSRGVQVAGLGELNVDWVSFSIYPWPQG